MPTITKITIHTDKGNLTIDPDDLDTCRITTYQTGESYPRIHIAGYLEFHIALPPHFEPKDKVNLYVSTEALDT